jgi:hypothetical protein
MRWDRSPDTRRCPRPTCPSDPHRPRPMRWSRSPERPEALSSGPNPSPGRLPGLKPAVPGFPWNPLPGFPVCVRLRSPFGSDYNFAQSSELFKPERWLLFAHHESFSRPTGTVAQCTHCDPGSCCSQRSLSVCLHADSLHNQLRNRQYPGSVAVRVQTRAPRERPWPLQIPRQWHDGHRRGNRDYRRLGLRLLRQRFGHSSKLR